MTSDVYVPVKTTNARLYLEWVVVVIGSVGGTVIAVSGVGYGLTNLTGVGAGFFPLVAGGAIALGSVLWAFQLLGSLRRHRRAQASSGCEPDAPAPRFFDADRVDPPTDTALGVLLVDGIDEEDDDIAMPDRHGVLRVFMVAFALVLAAILLPVLGYLLTITLMLFAVMTLVSARKWWVALLVSLGVAVLSRFVFADLLGTALPQSSIELLRVMGL